jgi:hypothetical protein
VLIITVIILYTLIVSRTAIAELLRAAGAVSITAPTLSLFRDNQILLLKQYFFVKKKSLMVAAYYNTLAC